MTTTWMIGYGYLLLVITLRELSASVTARQLNGRVAMKGM